MLQVYDHMMTHKISETWCSTCWLNFELPLVIVLKLNWWHKLLRSIVVPSVYKMVIFTSYALYTYITPLPGDYLIFKCCVWWSILCLGSCLSLHYNLSQVSCWEWGNTHPCIRSWCMVHLSTFGFNSQIRWVLFLLNCFSDKPLIWDLLKASLEVA